MTRNALHLEELSAEELEALRPEWQRLAKTTASISLFGAPLWVQNYSRYRKAAGVVARRLAARTADGELAGLALLAREGLAKNRLPALRAVHATGEYLADWICDPAHADAFVAQLYDRLARTDSRWFQLKINGVREDSPVLAAWRQLCQHRKLPCAEHPGTTVPFLGLDIPGEQATSLCSSKYRRELARRRRDLEKLGSVTIEDLQAASENVEAGLDEFIVLEASGWKGRDGGAIACQPDAQAFWPALVVEAAAEGRLWLSLLRCNEKPIAGQLGVTWRDTYYCLRVAYDEQYRRQGPGALLTQHVIQRCVEDPALKVYDFAGAAQPYMSNWTSLAYDSRTLLVGRPEVLPALAFRSIHGTRRMLAAMRRTLRHGANEQAITSHSD